MRIATIAILLALAPSTASAAGWFLIIFTDGTSTVIAPEAYPTRSACSEAGRAAIEGKADFFTCFPAP